MEFKEGFVADLIVPVGAKDVQAFDDELPGFGVRKFASGAAPYFVSYNVAPSSAERPWGASSRATSKRCARWHPTCWRTRGLAPTWSPSPRLPRSPVVTLGSLVPIYLAAR